MPESAHTCWSCQSFGNPHAGLLRCIHGFCTHARYGDVLRPPIECYMCTVNLGNWLQNDPIQTQEHTVFYDQISCDKQRLNELPISNPQDSAYILSQAQSQADEAPSISCGPNSKPEKPLDIQFQYSANHKVHEERPRRRGPLKEGSRDEMKKLRTSGGACWRCKVLRKQCDSSQPCKQCSNRKHKNWQLECQRGRLKDLVQGAIPDLALGSGEWFLSDIENTFRIRISYNSSTAESVFRDFKSGFGRVTALSQPAIPLYEFLEQFHKVNKRWVDCYSGFTENFLRQSAMFQKELLSKANDDKLADVSDKSILIALSLRCLVLTHEIFQVNISSTLYTFQDNKTRYQVQGYYRQDPDIEVSRLSSPASQASLVNSKQQKAPDSLSSILEGILQTTQQLMFRRSPEHWPMLLCTLCLMRMIVDNFSVYSPWMRSLEPACQAMGKAFSILCRLFDICAKDFNPFSENWNLEEYAVAVKDDRVLVGYAKKLQTMWLDEVVGYNDAYDKILEERDLETRITFFRS